jgi:hypothetical protein
MFTDERLRNYPLLVFGGLVIAVLLVVALSDGVRTVSGVIGGDLPAFHGAAELVATGRTDDLYHWDSQRDAQRELHPDARGSFLPFAYPPFVVLPYLALLPLGFVTAWLVHTAIMGGLLLLAVHALRPMLPRAAARTFPLFVLLLTFYPMFRGVVGGQNTALSFAILALTWRLLHDGRDTLAGSVAGLLLYKPQFGIPLLGLLMLARRPRVLVGAAGTALVLYLAGALLGGPGWPAWWWAQISRFHTMDQAINAPNSVGVLGFLEAVLGVGSAVAVVTGVLLSAAVVVLVMWLWFNDRIEPARRWAFTSVALVLVPPHSMFYDAGLAGLALAIFIDRTGTRSAHLAAAIWAAALLTPLSRAVGFSLMFPVLVLLLAALIRRDVWESPSAMVRGPEAGN